MIQISRSEKNQTKLCFKMIESVNFTKHPGSENVTKRIIYKERSLFQN
jgi:hypothetical protein